MDVALAMASIQMIHVQRVDGIAYQKKVNNRLIVSIDVSVIRGWCCLLIGKNKG